MNTFYTVRADHLIADAQRIEDDANASLNAWILCGMSDRYSQCMAQARAIRAAAGHKNITVRREILRDAGFIVKTPKQVLA